MFLRQRNVRNDQLEMQAILISDRFDVYALPSELSSYIFRCRVDRCEEQFISLIQKTPHFSLRFI